MDRKPTFTDMRAVESADPGAGCYVDGTFMGLPLVLDAGMAPETFELRNPTTGELMAVGRVVGDRVLFRSIESRKNSRSASPGDAKALTSGGN